MKRSTLGLFVALLFCTDTAAQDTGMTKKLADHPVRPTQSIWAPVTNLFNDNYKDQVSAEVINAVLRAYDPLTGRLMRLRVDASGNLIVAVTSSAGTPPWAKLDDDAASNCVAITTSSTQFTLPGSPGDWYCMSATGNNAYVKCGVNPTVATTPPGTAFAFVVPSGSSGKCRPLTGPKCAVIGQTANGSLCFEHLNPNL